MVAPKYLSTPAVGAPLKTIVSVGVPLTLETASVALLGRSCVVTSFIVDVCAKFSARTLTVMLSPAVALGDIKLLSIVIISPALKFSPPGLTPEDATVTDETSPVPLITTVNSASSPPDGAAE